MKKKTNLSKVLEKIYNVHFQKRNKENPPRESLRK